MRCVIITGGTVNDLNWLAGVLKESDMIICVDGGARYAAALGIIPQIIIGDLDSIGQMEYNLFTKQGTVIKKYPVDKDDTDTALALGEVLSDNPKEVIILGAIGTRFDHSLASVHLLRVAMNSGVRARIIDEYNEISLVAPYEKVIVDGEPGDLFSLLPLTEKVSGVNVKGARWPLQEANFIIGNPYGVSNQLAADKVEISIKSGLMLFVKINEQGEMKC